MRGEIPFFIELSKKNYLDLNTCLYYSNSTGSPYLLYLNKGGEKLGNSSLNVAYNKDVVSLVNSLECPSAQVISKITKIRNAYIDSDVVSLMAKSYSLGLYEGKSGKNHTID